MKKHEVEQIVAQRRWGIRD